MGLNRDIELKKCGNDLIHFGRLISKKTFWAKTKAFHEEIAQLMMDRGIEKLSIEAPRGTAKSTLTLLIALHHAIFDVGDKVIVIQSKTLREAKRKLRKIKSILEYSGVFRDLFGYCGEEVSEMWGAETIKTRIGRYKVTFEALGTGQPMRGILEDDTRVTLYILDDPEDEDNTKTRDATQDNYDKFLGNLAGLDRRNGRVIVIGTPVRQNCIVERLRNLPGWITRLYQIYNEGTGELLWEEMYDWNWIESKKAELSEANELRKFYSEYMCLVVGGEEQLFKPEYIQYYEGNHQKINGENFLIIGDEKKPVSIFLGIDPASSQSKTADYSVTLPIAVDDEENIYILPYFRKRVDPTEHAEQIISKIKELQPIRAHIETTGYQEMLRKYLKKRLIDEKITVGGLEKKINPRTEKSKRLEGMHHFFYNKKIFIRNDMRELLDELFMYPRGKHDDLLDGLFYATLKIIPPYHVYQEKTLEEDSKYFAFQENYTWAGW